MRGFAKHAHGAETHPRAVRRAPRVSSPGNPERTHYIVDKFFQFANVKKQTRCLRCRLVARAVDQSAGIVTRNTNSWSGNECFNNANSPSVSPCIPPLVCRSPPSVPGHGSQNLFSSADRCNFALSWQRRVHRSSDVSRPPPLHTLSLQSAVNCFQLNCLPFSRHPFAARHRLFAPLNAARFRDVPNFHDTRCRDIVVERHGERGDANGCEGTWLGSTAPSNDPIIDIAIRYRIAGTLSFRRV